ncbi:MAG: preprotein translocase subunit SecA [Candidatus Magasanikbacteria bacterium]
MATKIQKAFEKVFGSNNERTLKKFQPIVEKINSFEKDFQALSEEQLKGKTAEFKKRLAEGETMDDILPEAFATVRESAVRVLGMRHYDVQMIGGLALHNRMIGEMRTGEGKTLTATLAVYLNALDGKGVHVVTVNDYLARRDAVWMGQLYDYLGLSIGIIQQQRQTYIYDSSAKIEEKTEEGSEVDRKRDDLGSFKIQYDYLRPATRQEAYRADITYGTNNEYGFDYLRDNMVQDVSLMVMRPGDEMHYAIIDEVDSILIDEARTPLIISAPAEQATDMYYRFASLVRQLKETEDYNVDEKLRSATLTENGIAKFEKWLNMDNIYVEGGLSIVHHIEEALKAEMLFKRDKDYVVEEGEVIIIDEFTGRKMPGRRYSGGLHQAIEAKENVEIQRESQTLATITFQNFFRMYRKLSGMTGTAETEAEEFRQIYALDILVVPTNKEDKRLDHSDRIYKTERGKFKAIVEKIKECQAKGQPILIGTISVEKNEMLSGYLTQNGIQHEILNAKNHEREGEIIALAGKPNSVTLATNMAGRGVDIKLGGPLEEEKEKVLQAGGLFVLGTERHESRRIDNQLRGRSARQGDPGETQFFVSTGDDLMRIFAGDRLKSLMDRLKVPEDMPIEQNTITRMLEGAQKKVEGHNYDIRKHLLSYDDILNKQRNVIYKRRREILDLYKQAKDIAKNTSEKTEEPGRTLENVILELIESDIEFVVSYHTNDQAVEGAEKKEWNMKEILETMQTIFPFSPEEKEKLLSMGPTGKAKMNEAEARTDMIEFLVAKAKIEFGNTKQKIGQVVGSGTPIDAAMAELIKDVMLRAIDGLWVDYLVDIDNLRNSIGLQGYGQRDPLVEYKKEAFYMFNALQTNIQKEVVYAFFKVSFGIQLAPSVMANDKLSLKGAEKTSSSAQESGAHMDGKKKMSKKERRKLKNKRK